MGTPLLQWDIARRAQAWLDPILDTHRAGAEAVIACLCWATQETAAGPQGSHGSGGQLRWQCRWFGGLRWSLPPPWRTVSQGRGTGRPVGAMDESVGPQRMAQGLAGVQVVSKGLLLNCADRLLDLLPGTA
ncbi:hypothetical protein NDU88_004684 [Pleurodeles waltl]|uniref:Uncharacterized protein n=1 Tax=Pleurodeles waltl TaxID=8319 RepID=A0AAV7MUL0_PLEWA|nr:hypothetical protein NDU88_004684 [Pleurodeles waltl]